MAKLQFEDLPRAMEQVLERLESIENELREARANLQPKVPEELMTRHEVADFFKVTLSTIWKWSKNGNLTYYGVGNRVYYKRSEIEKAMIKIN